MDEKDIDKMLHKLAERATEKPRPGLCEQIKRHIPRQLTHHRKPHHTISIMIDLRINKLAAAGIVIAAMILLAAIFRKPHFSDNGLYQEGKVLARYFLGDLKENKLQTEKLMLEHLLRKGKKVVFYGESRNPKDSNSILMHWKVSDDKYKVIFNDLSEKQVTADELIKLQAKMLQKAADR